MVINSQINVTFPSGRVLSLKNSLTYTGVDLVASAIANRDPISFTHFYIRHATAKSDAEDPSTKFHTTNDLNAVTREDFAAETGGAGYAVMPLSAGMELSSSDKDKYTNNRINYPVSFTALDMGSQFKDTNQANYSIIYYMGLATRPLTVPEGGTQLEVDNGEHDSITSVIKVGQGDYFGIPSTGTVNVDYKLTLAVA